METNNKYYTPDKSEYHIGFEYQSLTDPRQPENDIAWSDEELRTEVDMMNVFKYMIEDDFLEHRCKYLDKEDIQSLCNEFNYKLINTYKGPQGMERYDIIDSNGTILMEYITRCMTNFSIGNINITIRNKSELKVLFKQINI